MDRVRDWRIGRLHNLPNVEIYLDSRLGPDDVAELGADHVICPPGASWRRDGVGTMTRFGVSDIAEARALAEQLAGEGHDIT